MKAIYKYPLEYKSTPWGPIKLMLPPGSTILNVVLEPNETIGFRQRPLVYALVPITNVQPSEPYEFLLLPTGDEMSDKALTLYRFMATLQRADGIVLHVFWRSVN